MKRKERKQKKLDVADTQTTAQKKKTALKITVFSLAILGLIAAIFLFVTSPDERISKLDTFAKCITEKKAVMYGVDWCPHCQAQKKRFGSSFQHVNYVNCEKDKASCLENGISGYPTWIFNSTERKSGELELADLSELTGCELPKD